MVRIDLRTVVIDVPPQDVITRDNVSVKVNAVVYFRVVDPAKAVIQVEHYFQATSQLAQTTLRAVLGKHELDELLAEREKLNADIQQRARCADRRVGHQGIDRGNQGRRPQRDDDPRDRAPGRGRARAAREDHPRGRANCRHRRSCCRRRRCSRKQPQAMQLRYLQTLTNIAADKNSTIVFPLPIDLITSLLDRLKRE